jgi:hypothetical protein
MPDEYEFYQGAVLRQLIVDSDISLAIRPFVRDGRISAFVINGRVGVYVKHSSKRMTPWRFTFTLDQAADLLDLEAKYPDSFVAFVCESDGIVTLEIGALHSIVDFQRSEHAWVRIDRPPRNQYEVSGNRGTIPTKLARGIGTINETLRIRVKERYGASGL